MNDALAISALTFGAQAFVTLFVILDPPGAAPIFPTAFKRQQTCTWELTLAPRRSRRCC